MSAFGRRFGSIYRKVRTDMFALAREMNLELTPQQSSAVRAIHDDLRSDKPLRRIAIKSGQGTGKTTLSCLFGFWRALQDIDAMVVTTAPTMRQCSDVWIAELSRQLQHANPDLTRFVEVFKTSVQIGGRPNWGVKCITATRPENMQGLHQDYLTIIMEEASGIQRSIWETIKGTLTNENSYLFAIGNPNTRQCEFYGCFTRNRSQWNTLTFNSEHSPIVDKRNLKAIEEEYGRNSDVYRVRVLGEFPYQDPNSIFSSDDLEACTITNPGDALSHPKGRRSDGTWSRQIGIDLARFGADESVIVVRSGLAVVAFETFSKTEPTEVLKHAFRIQSSLGWKDDDTLYVVDAGGMGQGVMGNLYSARKRVHEFHTQGTSTKRDYANKMSEGWFELSKLAKERILYIPKDQRMIQQLTSRQYVFDRSDGKLKVESKDDYLKREPMGEETSSPDRADAIVMAFYQGATAGTRI